MNVNEGMLFGNMVSQEPVASGHDPLFCKFSTKGSEDLQEVDSVIVDGGRSIPIECKSGNMSSSHISLDRLMGGTKGTWTSQMWCIPRTPVWRGRLCTSRYV